VAEQSDVDTWMAAIAFYPAEKFDVFQDRYFLSYQPTVRQQRAAQARRKEGLHEITTITGKPSQKRNLLIGDSHKRNSSRRRYRPILCIAHHRTRREESEQPDRAREFEDMSVDEYAEHKGFHLSNPRITRKRNTILTANGTTTES
jgi:hypothetical protein